MAEETLVAWESWIPEIEELVERSRRAAAVFHEGMRSWEERRCPVAKSLEKSTAANEFTCAVCLEDLAVGSEITKMPCSHQYHPHCILKWLDKRHTCPICRFQLPSHQQSSS